MTIKVSFHLFETPDDKQYQLYICRLVEKIYHSNRLVYIYSTDATTTQNLDTQLWTFRDVSFVPHSIYPGSTDLQTIPPPVIIGHIAPPAESADVLINLTTTIPTFYPQFQHVIEVIPTAPDARANARSRYQYYQQQNCALETHKINSDTDRMSKK